ncbi:MAG: orotidine-5'-phosphate decarboxylase [Legionellales bacterium]|nr:orotidine-5'-phosphate decarboxylase [Legionellales bacterium]
MSYEAPKVIVALDDINEKSVWQLVDQLSPEHCRLKVGKALFTACGPALVKKLVQRNYAVFLDLKFHDIPNTVANACQAAADLGVWMINVHASGGLAMMQAARASIENYDSLLIGVTVLTSFDQHTLAEIGVADVCCEQQVLRLAALTKQAGLDGVVCSPQEAMVLNAKYGREFCLVTPGVRCLNDSNDDQKRIVTPEIALANGADYLVIGRSITRAISPVEKLSQINKVINLK